jgi:predicted secreted protein
MPAQRGSDLLIKRGDGQPTEVFTTVGALQSSTLRINGNPIEVTTADDVDVNGEIWKTFITGPKDLGVSGNGIGKALEPIQSVYNDYATGAITNYQLVVPNLGTFTVAMIVGNMEFSGQYDGVAGFSLDLQSAAAPTFAAEAAA